VAAEQMILVMLIPLQVLALQKQKQLFTVQTLYILQPHLIMQAGELPVLMQQPTCMALLPMK